MKHEAPADEKTRRLVERQQASLDMREPKRNEHDHDARVPPQRVPHEERYQARS